MLFCREKDLERREARLKDPKDSTVSNALGSEDNTPSSFSATPGNTRDDANAKSQRLSPGKPTLAAQHSHGTRRKSLFFPEDKSKGLAPLLQQRSQHDSAVSLSLRMLSPRQEQHNLVSPVTAAQSGIHSVHATVDEAGPATAPVRRLFPMPHPRAMLEQRLVRVYVCSSLADDDHHMQLREWVYPRLHSDAARRGLVLQMVDLRDEHLLQHVGEDDQDQQHATIIDQMVYEMHRCAPIFICLLGEDYLDAVGIDIVKSLADMGHEWVRSDASLHEASVTDLLVRQGVLHSKNQWAMAFLQREAIEEEDAQDEAIASLDDAIQVSADTLVGAARQVLHPTHGCTTTMYVCACLPTRLSLPASVRNVRAGACMPTYTKTCGRSSRFDMHDGYFSHTLGSFDTHTCLTRRWTRSSKIEAVRAPWKRHWCSQESP
jgi:hypothetical protein